MADIEFTDNSVRVKAALDNAINAWLLEAGGALEAQTKKNTSNRNYGKRDVKNSWHYKVDESKKEAWVGSDIEAAYWEEFGTGEHALYHNGRKGGGCMWKGMTHLLQIRRCTPKGKQRQLQQVCEEKAWMPTQPTEMNRTDRYSRHSR